MPARAHEVSQSLCLDPEGGISRLLEIMRRLRDPNGGCPWDIEQDFHTIAPYTLEEAYEVADAIAREDWCELKTELGDLLLQAVYHSQIASERGLFDFAGAVSAVCDKMISRHPHVFGQGGKVSASEQVERWEQAKASERGAAHGRSGALDGVAKALPALTRAAKLQKRAARVGFDWRSADAVIPKIIEEAGELAAACEGGDSAKTHEEFGDLLFTLVNYARHLGIDPESALRSANRKFETRFGRMERSLAADGQSVHDAETETMELHWNEVKKRG